MEMIVNFPGGTRVDAHFRGMTIPTDQPRTAGGEDSAASPYETFLAALATCAGIYVLGFCRQRGLPTEGIRLVQSVEYDPTTKLATKVALEIQLPPDFPDKYKDAVIRAASQCKVKKQLEHPPDFEVKTSNAFPAVS